MIGSSVMVHAAETDGSPASASPVWEGQADMTGEIQEPEEPLLLKLKDILASFILT